MRDLQTVIVGGGIVGLSAAYFLARRGEPVVVLDRDALGSSASSRNAGLLAAGHPPLPRPGLHRDLLRLLFGRTGPLYIAPRLDLDLYGFLRSFLAACDVRCYRRSLEQLCALGWAASGCIRELIEQESIDCEYRRLGWLEVFGTSKGLEHGQAVARELRALGYTIDELDGHALRAREPAFRETVVGALHHVDSAFAHPSRFMKGLAQAATHHGADLRFETPVKELHRDGGRLRAVTLADGERMEPRRVVLAAGAWTTELARQIGVRLPMQPGKGYQIDLAPPVPQLGCACVLGETFVAVNPLSSGMRLAGTLEISGFGLEMNARRLAMLRSGAQRFLDGTEDAPTQDSWCGHRPLTSDGLPAVGWARGVENVFLATGHAMMGFLLGPLTGRLVSEFLLDGRPSIDVSALAPDRLCETKLGA